MKKIVLELIPIIFNICILKSFTPILYMKLESVASDSISGFLPSTLYFGMGLFVVTRIMNFYAKNMNLEKQKQSD